MRKYLTTLLALWFLFSASPLVGAYYYSDAPYYYPGTTISYPNYQYYQYDYQVPVAITPTVRTDYFTENVTDTSLELAQIEHINLPRYTFRDAGENSRYASALHFIDGIKTESKRRYSEGLITAYRMNDIIQDLGALVYNLGEHFSYSKRYEQTRRAEYREASKEYFGLAKQWYGKLKGSLNRSGY